MTIDPEEVDKAFLDSLFRDTGEVANPGQLPAGAVVAEGVTASYGFHPQRLESHRDQVRAWLASLPRQFHLNTGGGWSFLNACETRDGEQWTGLHQRIEQLFALGIGLGLVRWVLPRDMWETLPGGMPYVVIDLDQHNTAAR